MMRARIEAVTALALLAVALLCCKSPPSSRKSPPPAPTAGAPREPVIPVRRHFPFAAVEHHQQKRPVLDPPDLVREREILPQIAKPGALFDDLPDGPPRAVDTSTGLLVCRIVVGGSWEPGNDTPDPYGTLRLYGYGDVFFSHSERQVFYLTLPAPNLRPSAKGALHLVDSDTMFDDDMGTLHFRYEGEVPFRFRHKQHTHELQCRFLDADGVNKAAEPLAVKAKVPVARAKTPPRVTLDKEHFGYETSALRDAWRSVDAVAAYTGWDHELVKPLEADLLAAETAWRAAVTKRLDVLTKTLPAPGTSLQLKLWKIAVKKVTCDRARAERYMKGHKPSSPFVHPCFVELSMEKHADQRGGIGYLNLQAIDGSGMDVGLSVVEVFTEENVVYDRLHGVPAGVPITAIAMPLSDVALGTHPGSAPANRGRQLRLLRVCREGRRCVLRLE